MKIWLVIFLVNQVVGISLWGGSDRSCLDLIDERHELALRLAAPGLDLAPEDVTFACIGSSDQPYVVGDRI